MGGNHTLIIRIQIIIGDVPSFYHLPLLELDRAYLYVCSIVQEYLLGTVSGKSQFVFKNSQAPRLTDRRPVTRGFRTAI